MQSLRKYRVVDEIRGGLGLDCSIFFVKDKESNGKFSPEEQVRFLAVLRKKLRQVGLWGAVGNPTQLKPPLIITKSEVDEIINGYDKVLGEIEES